ncbi:MAG: OHCU decarboxylase [Rhodothermales bacterium]|jgi:OHCU decarboxylase
MKWLNDLPSPEAAAHLFACCGSEVWVAEMTAARPFEDSSHLMTRAAEIWASVGAPGYLDAFAAHPKIGDKEALRSKFSRDRWAGDEQAGASRASDRVLDELAAANHLYEDRFGYIFIICATGKSAEEMLAALRARLENSPEFELRLAAAEQARITRLRLEKILAEHAS